MADTIGFSFVVTGRRNILEEQIVAKVITDLQRSGRYESFCGFYDMATAVPGFKMTLDQVEHRVT
ncbi:hypothetical protein TYRP_009207 [Tyrophagus putrescentiae]|nr:hypothetical protein TYRP_009207 [Tyrophagus putrescentiae]